MATEVTLRVRFEEGTTEWFQPDLVARAIEDLYSDADIQVTAEVIDIEEV